MSDKYSAFVQSSDSVASVLMGNGLQQSAKVGTAKLRFGDCAFTQTVGVMPMNGSFDLVLGQDWLNEHSAVLSYDRDDPDLRGNDKRHVTFKFLASHTMLQCLTI